jgi:diguanylate cyclase (GGDEF)-like protein
MKSALLPDNETGRLLALDEYGILDTPADPLFDRITELAAQICDAPIALFSLIDRNRQWFKSAQGLPGVTETPRDIAFCAHAILSDELLEVPDASHDVRFHDNPLVAAHPKIRFYAGMPLQNANGFGIGTLCVIDRAPRVLTQAQRRALDSLSHLAIALLEQRKTERQALERERRQDLIADFGQRALADPDPDTLLAQAVRVVSETLDFEYCEILELDQDDQSLVMKAAVGWPAEVVGQRISEIKHGEDGAADDTLEARTQARQALAQRIPMVVQNFAEETRCTRSALAARHHILSGLNVLIPGSQKPFGVLGVHATATHSVTPDDISFVQSVANIVATALTRQQADARLAYMAQFDTLTGLPNRHLFRDRLSQSLARAERNSKPIAVLVLNLDGFKRINNNHGHGAGDQLLLQVTQRLIAAVRTGDTVSRMGGDEFGIVLSDLGRAEDTAQVIQKLLSAMGRPFSLPDGEVFISASAGVALFDADGHEADVLIKHAEIALQRAKEQDRNTYQFYAPQMNQRALERMRLEYRLRHALERNELLLHYQPKFCIATGQICGAEALLRWQHPERGLVPPAEFIPVLEDTGLIVPVGLWVLESACRQMQAWREAGLRVPAIAVNLSARQFQQTDLDVRMRDIITAAGIDPNQIELEITESMLMHDPRQAVTMLHKLKRLGVRLSVDDFGTGYSSLAYLKQFPLDALKIDRTFIRNITDDTNDAAITLAIINLAHNLHMQVVAEGVETPEQVRFLIEHGCDVLQGFHFSRPVDAQAYGQMLKDGKQLVLPTEMQSSTTALLWDDSDYELLFENDASGAER